MIDQHLHEQFTLIPRELDHKTRIVVTSDLDEHAIASLASAPVDGYGVGTSLVTGSGHPTCGFVYKLVAREGADGAMADVAKKSKDKISVGGRKFAGLEARQSEYVVETPRSLTPTNHTPVETTVRARRSGGFRSSMTRAADNNAEDQNGNSDRIDIVPVS